MHPSPLLMSKLAARKTPLDKSSVEINLRPRACGFSPLHLCGSAAKANRTTNRATEERERRRGEVEKEGGNGREVRGEGEREEMRKEMEERKGGRRK